ncbi:M16 family metallopeptidase [Streptomyces sp. NRRL F-5126]|uniref:M16 family metallopeptidase n=1 Tax=Streptomyces sp. NRRL F-5126 TaxID=1463857 RepID=UPI000B092A02|nr:insulinase family protein [Streptomyces sp. NRRL F-5126]
MPENTTTVAGAARADGVRETEVCGIRAFLASPDAKESTEGREVSAGLAFRVGTVDETYATHGISHLVEHLALHRQGVTEAHYNGATTSTATVFHVSGTEEEVVAYLNGVCASLRDLPLDRLETEREILRTEASGRSDGPNQALPLWRYGAQGYGLASYTELGSWHLGADAVRDWARTRFTRGNAVLWITSDTVPGTLELALPDGELLPTPEATSALPVTPACVRGGDGVVVADGVVRRSVAATVFADVLGRALYTDLRQTGGYSYTATAAYVPRDAEYATITAYADALPKKQDAVVGGFVDALARLRTGHVEQSELDSVRAKRLRSAESQTREPDALVVSRAMNALTGHESLAPAQWRAELEALTVGDVRDVARAWYSTSLLQAPGRGADWAGFTEAPQFSVPESAVTGTRHRSIEDAEWTLVIGEDGVGFNGPGDRVTTVRYADCAALVAYPDGGRLLTGLDGFLVAVEPTMFANVTQSRIALIDRSVPPAALVLMPMRDPERIPRPDVPAAASTVASAASTAAEGSRPVPRSRRWRAVLVGARILTLFFGLAAAFSTLGELDSPDKNYAEPVVLWVLAIGAMLLAQAAMRRRGRTRGRAAKS